MTPSGQTAPGGDSLGSPGHPEVHPVEGNITNNPTYKDVLRDVQGTLVRGWTKLHRAAEDSQGRATAAYSEHACAWSLLGAVNHAPFDDSLKMQALGVMRTMLPRGVTVTMFNETASCVEDVLALVQKAIDR